MSDEQAPILGDMPTTSDSPTDLRAEVGEIMRDPMWGRDPALTEKVDALYRTRYGQGEVSVGSGITVEGTLVDTTGAAASADSLPPWAQEAKSELGNEWDTAVEKLGAVGEKLFGGDERAEAAFMNKLRVAGWTDRQIFNAVQKLEE